MTGVREIDTTPISPRPPEMLVDEAAKAVPPLMADVRPASDGKAVLKASALVLKLREKGHTLSAAEWAIHALAKDHKLIPERIVVHLPYLGEPGSYRTGP